MAVTYNSLVESIKNYCERTDNSFVEEIPTFIKNTESKMCREATTIGFVRYVSGHFQTGEPVLAKPARWRRTITFSYGAGEGFNERVFLEQRTYEYVNMYAYNRTLLSAPIFYSDYDFNTLLVGPTPDLDYPFEFAYIELPVPLNVKQQTNWITNYASDVLLAGSMVEALLFLKDDEKLATWEPKYNRGIQSLTAQDSQSHRDRQSNREAE